MATVLGLVVIAAVGIAVGYRTHMRARRGFRHSATYTGNAWSDGGGGTCGGDGGGGGDC